MHPHERHTVTVYGEKPPFTSNQPYYFAIPATAMEFSEEKGVPVVFKQRLQESGPALIDIITPTKEFAEGLARKILALRKYTKVEVDSRVVDLDNLGERN